MKKADQIKAMLRTGASYSVISETLGASKSVISYHAKNLGLSSGHRSTYDWQAVQAFIDEGNSVAEIQLKFGMSRAAIGKAISKGTITYTRACSTADEYAATIEGKATSADRGALKRRLIREGRKEECEICKISEWLGKPIVLHLDHINGDGRENGSHNLRLLCPNCHSQTETYGGKNAGTYACDAA
jgi:uncharacterized protein YerC